MPGKLITVGHKSIIHTFLCIQIYTNIDYVESSNGQLFTDAVLAAIFSTVIIVMRQFQKSTHHKSSSIIVQTSTANRSPENQDANLAVHSGIIGFASSEEGDKHVGISSILFQSFFGLSPMFSMPVSECSHPLQKQNALISRMICFHLFMKILKSSFKN